MRRTPRRPYLHIKYIEKLVKKLEEAARAELFAQAQLELVNEINSELSREIERLKAERDRLTEQQVNTSVSTD